MDVIHWLYNFFFPFRIIIWKYSCLYAWYFDQLHIHRIYQERCASTLLARCVNPMVNAAVIVILKQRLSVWHSTMSSGSKPLTMQTYWKCCRPTMDNEWSFLEPIQELVYKPLALLFAYILFWIRLILADMLLLVHNRTNAWCWLSTFFFYNPKGNIFQLHLSLL